jgi:hypothetical protein
MEKYLYLCLTPEAPGASQLVPEAFDAYYMTISTAHRRSRSKKRNIINAGVQPTYINKNPIPSTPIEEKK